MADERTLEALIANRYESWRPMPRACAWLPVTEFEAMKARSADAAVIKAAQRWMHRDEDKVPASAAPHLAQARAASPVLDKMVTMREELRQMWLNTSVSREQLDPGSAGLVPPCGRERHYGAARVLHAFKNVLSLLSPLPGRALRHKRYGFYFVSPRHLQKRRHSAMALNDRVWALGFA